MDTPCKNENDGVRNLDISGHNLPNQLGKYGAISIIWDTTQKMLMGYLNIEIGHIRALYLEWNGKKRSDVLPSIPCSEAEAYAERNICLFFFISYGIQHLIQIGIYLIGTEYRDVLLRL